VPEVVTDAMIDTKISFLSKHPNDDVVWTGTVLGLVTYPIAKSYTDVVSYRGAVLAVDPLIPAVDILNYFLLRLDDVEGQPIYAFASEFIVDASLEALDPRVVVTIRVYDLASNIHTDILDVLRANGYRNCNIANVSS